MKYNRSATDGKGHAATIILKNSKKWKKIKFTMKNVLFNNGIIGYDINFFIDGYNQFIFSDMILKKIK